MPCSPPSTRSRRSWPATPSTFVESDEDIHTAVERRVTELAGAAGAKLHTARSRNDQVATDLRLWCKRELAAIADRHRRHSSTCCSPAPRPTRPATSPASPTCNGPSRSSSLTTCSPTAGRLARDVDRLLATIARLDVSPLGAGALAGTSLPIDPAMRGRGPRIRRGVRQLARRRRRPRLRRRGAVRPRPARHPPVADRRGVRAVDQRGVRLRPSRRRLRDRLVDAAAEEEPGHRRARPRQGGSSDRQPHRPAGDAQGTSAGVQPRPPRGQGAVVRLRRPGRPRRSLASPG